jgi:hypothetical protein
MVIFLGLPKFAAVVMLWENETMDTLKPKVKAAHKDAPTAGRCEVGPAQSRVANPYAMSPQAAAKAVLRAGIVTAGGKLTRVYK